MAGKEVLNQPAEVHNFEALFGLRAFASFWVVMFHVCFFWNILNNKFIRSAAVAPDIFFILSGFIISYHYYKLFDQKISTDKYLKYISKRFFRVWPGLVFIYLIGILIYWILINNSNASVKSDLSFKSFFLSFFLIITITYVWFSQDRIEMRNLLWDKINVSLWTISAEWLSYLIFPFACFCIRGLPWKITLYLSFILWVCLGLVAALQPNGLMHCLYGYTALLRSISDFFIGIVTCLMFFKLNPSSNQRNLLTLISVLFLSMFIYLDIVNIQFLMLPFCGLFILGLTARHKVSLFFSHPIMVYLGELSYSIYLVHWLILNMFHYFLTHEAIERHLTFFLNLPNLVQNNIKYELFFLLSFFMVVLLFSVFLFNFIERPCRAYFLKKLSV